MPALGCGCYKRRAECGRDGRRSATASQRALVVDDDRDVADTLVMLLQHFGVDVRVAYDGGAALAIVAGFKPHLALVDIGMPGMDGYEAARQIRKLPEGRDLRLVALSGWVEMKIVVSPRTPGLMITLLSH